MKTIKFAKNYKKLQDNFFTTIRTPPKNIRTGQTCIIQSPSEEFKAILARKITLPVKDIETSILTYDTDTESRDKALEVLREYYPHLDEKSEVQVMWFVPDWRDWNGFMWFSYDRSQKELLLYSKEQGALEHCIYAKHEPGQNKQL